jgi:Sulfotransferase family
VSGMGRAGLIAAAAPESRIILLVRHPCGQVESMLRGIRAHLFEDQYPLEDICVTPQARRRNLTAGKLAKLSLPAKLAWHWVLQNEMAYEGLAGLKRATILPYIRLAEQPLATAKSLFEFCELDWRPEVDAFVRYTTQGKGRTGYYDIRRDPLAAANSWRQRLSKGEVEEICAIAAQSEVGHLFGDALIDAAAAAGQAGRRHALYGD